MSLEETVSEENVRERDNLAVYQATQYSAVSDFWPPPFNILVFIVKRSKEKFYKKAKKESENMEIRSKQLKRQESNVIARPIGKTMLFKAFCKFLNAEWDKLVTTFKSFAPKRRKSVIDNEGQQNEENMPMFDDDDGDDAMFGSNDDDKDELDFFETLNRYISFRMYHISEFIYRHFFSLDSIGELNTGIQAIEERKYIADLFMYNKMEKARGGVNHPAGAGNNGSALTSTKKFKTASKVVSSLSKFKFESKDGEEEHIDLRFLYKLDIEYNDEAEPLQLFLYSGWHNNPDNYDDMDVLFKDEKTKVRRRKSSKSNKKAPAEERQEYLNNMDFPNNHSINREKLINNNKIII